MSKLPLLKLSPKMSLSPPPRPYKAAAEMGGGQQKASEKKEMKPKMTAGSSTKDGIGLLSTGMTMTAASGLTIASGDRIGHFLGGGTGRGQAKMPLPMLVMIAAVILAIAVVGIPGADGYNIDRLYNNGLSDAQQKAMMRQMQSTDELWRSTKKSPEFNAAKLTKFAGNGARNCFFTPIQCMLQHDVNKLRRMVDPADIGQIS